MFALGRKNPHREKKSLTEKERVSRQKKVSQRKRKSHEESKRFMMKDKISHGERNCLMSKENFSKQKREKVKNNSDKQNLLYSSSSQRNNFSLFLKTVSINLKLLLK